MLFRIFIKNKILLIKQLIIYLKKVIILLGGNYMKGKTKKIIGVVIVIAILLLPIIVDYFKESKGSTMNYQNYIKTLESGEFALIYYGDTDEENFSDISKILDAKKAKHKIYFAKQY